jgi:Tol biopolymer transport system component
VQVTAGSGEPDNPSAIVSGPLVAFDADGSYADGVGAGVGHRQIFLKNQATNGLTRVSDAADGDSVRPSLDERGRHLVFESTAALLGGASGRSQIFVHDVALGTLRRLTHGAGPSTASMLTKLGRIVAFESTAALLGDGHDTGISQIFWYDLSRGELHQLTDGNGPSRHPYVTNRLRSQLKKLVGRGAAITFDSSATNLRGTAGGPHTQVYLASTGSGDLPPILQITPTAAPGCTPPGPGDGSYPAFDANGRRIAFVSTGDLLCNATTGSRAFVLDPRRFPPTLLQVTGRGDVAGPLGASLGSWFLTLSTTDDASGQGVCGHQLQLVDFFEGHWQPASQAGEIPLEPPSGDPAASCDDGDPCTSDECVTAVCQHTLIPCP